VGILHALRSAGRALGRSPGYTIVATLTLALGIGSNLAIFSVADGALIRPLPFDQPDRLVRIQRGNSAVDLRDLLTQSTVFETLAGWRAREFDLTEGPVAERINGALVTGGLFDLFRRGAALGRTLGAGDDRVGGPRVVVLGDRFWKTRLGGDPAVLGRSVSFEGSPATVVGILPPGFRIPFVEAEVFAPLHVESPEEAQARGAHTLRAAGRLRAGVSQEGAQAALDVVAGRLAAQYPEENRDRRFILEPLHRSVVGEIRPVILILAGAVGLVLLIACANVVNLTLARAAARGHDTTVRAALGAPRARLAVDALAESFLVALIGGAIGLLCARWTIDSLLVLAGDSLPRLLRIDLDGRALAVAAGLVLLATALSGLIPALQGSRPDLRAALAIGPGGGGPSHTRIRSLLVVGQVALAMILLVGSGLLLRSLGRLTAVDPGFQPGGLLTFHVSLPLSRYRDIPRRTLFWNAVADRVAALPGVVAVGAISELPYGPGATEHNVLIDGRPPRPVGTDPEIASRTVLPGTFAAIGLPLVAGRDFSADDHAGALPVAILNEAAVRAHFPGEDPIGKRVAWVHEEPRTWLTIVGVAADFRGTGLDTGEVPAIYTPVAQEIRWWKTWIGFVVRAPHDPEGLGPSVREAVAAVDRTIAVADTLTMEARIAASVGGRRFQLAVLGAFAILAVLLAALGVYGVVSWSVAHRTREFGIRMALGARPRDLFREVLGGGLALVLAGLGLGVAGAFALTGLLAAMLFGVGRADPLTFVAAAALFVLVAAIASLVPAGRAARVDPMVALRTE
jgi:predicted permease